jgi:hypothetical protein
MHDRKGYGLFSACPENIKSRVDTIHPILNVTLNGYARCVWYVREQSMCHVMVRVSAYAYAMYVQAETRRSHHNMLQHSGGRECRMKKQGGMADRDVSFLF